MTSDIVAPTEHVFKLLVTGPFAAGKTSLIQAVSQTPVVDTDVSTSGDESAIKARTTVAMDFGTYRVDNESDDGSDGDPVRLLLFGTPGQRRFWFMTDILKGDVDAVIYVIDADAEHTHHEAGEAMRSLIADLPRAAGGGREPVRRSRHGRAVGPPARRTRQRSRGAVPVDPHRQRAPRGDRSIAGSAGPARARSASAAATRPGRCGMTIDVIDTSELLGLADAFPRPGWIVLDAARDRRFTGELLFSVAGSDTTGAVYADRGVLYSAERDDEPSLGTRLVEAGALTATQRERGALRIGPDEHLGRLFERVPSVDRHLVIVTAESMTEAVLGWLAARRIASLRVIPYRHHPAGVLRWLQPPATQAGDPLPAPPADAAPIQDRAARVDVHADLGRRGSGPRRHDPLERAVVPGRAGR